MAKKEKSKRDLAWENKRKEKMRSFTAPLSPFDLSIPYKYGGRKKRKQKSI